MMSNNREEARGAERRTLCWNPGNIQQLKERFGLPPRHLDQGAARGNAFSRAPMASRDYCSS
jgi:hypothetical protein